MCFNRYMVECEYQKNASIYTMTLVLIDTWWNVNSASQIRPLTQEAFNRYMVECESYGVFNALIFLTVLIDTWWNVNTTEVLTTEARKAF